MGNDLLNAVNTAIGAGIGAAFAHIVGATGSSSGGSLVFGP
jgi:hypothetical protein